MDLRTPEDLDAEPDLYPKVEGGPRQPDMNLTKLRELLKSHQPDVCMTCVEPLKPMISRSIDHGPARACACARFVLAWMM